MSDPDVDHARAAMAALDHLVVQDIFLTETAYLADVVLPVTAWPERVGTVTDTDPRLLVARLVGQGPLVSGSDQFPRPPRPPRPRAAVDGGTMFCARW